MSCLCPWCEEHHPELDMMRDEGVPVSMFDIVFEQRERCRQRAKLLELRREIQNGGDT